MSYRTAGLFALGVGALLSSCGGDPRAKNPAAWDGIKAELTSAAGTHFGSPVEVKPIGRNITGAPCGWVRHNDQTYFVYRSAGGFVASRKNESFTKAMKGDCRLKRDTPARAPGELGAASDSSALYEQPASSSHTTYSAGLTAVRSRLKDPSSAIFRDTQERAGTVCGWVNSNNGLGGKTGFQRFVAKGSLAFLEEEMAPGEMNALFAQSCGR